MAPKVSIVIPVYNVEAYLDECLDSVCGQTLKDIEVICVNDGSTDGSLAILEARRQADSRIVLIDKQNAGYGAAMNDGIAAASGEYVGIVEPDDYIALNMYEDLYAIAHDHDLDFVKADFYRFTRDACGDMMLIYVKLDATGRWYGRVFDPSTQPEALELVMNTWSGIYRREFLAQNDIRHNESAGASFQDNGFWVQTFAFARRAMIVGRPYYRNRRDNPSSSVRSTGKVYAMNGEYDYIFQRIRQVPEVWKIFEPMLWKMRFRNYLFTLERIDDSFKPEYIRRVHGEFERPVAEGLVDRGLFDAYQLGEFNFIMSDPEGYIRQRVRPAGEQQPVDEAARQAARIRKLEAEVRSLRKVKRSKSYRLGHAMLWLPRKVRKAVSKVAR